MWTDFLSSIEKHKDTVSETFWNNLNYVGERNPQRALALAEHSDTPLAKLATAYRESVGLPENKNLRSMADIKSQYAEMYTSLAGIPFETFSETVNQSTPVRAYVQELQANLEPEISSIKKGNTTFTQIRDLPLEGEVVSTKVGKEVASAFLRPYGSGKHYSRTNRDTLDAAGNVLELSNFQRDLHIVAYDSVNDYITSKDVEQEYAKHIQQLQLDRTTKTELTHPTLVFADNDLVFTDARHHDINSLEHWVKDIPNNWQGKVVPSGTRYEKMKTHEPVREGTNRLPTDIEDAKTVENKRLQDLDSAWDTYKQEEIEFVTEQSYGKSGIDDQQQAEKEFVTQYYDKLVNKRGAVHSSEELREHLEKWNSMGEYLFRGTSAYEKSGENTYYKVQQKEHPLGIPDSKGNPQRLYSTAASTHRDYAARMFANSFNDQSALLAIPWSSVKQVTPGTDVGEVSMDEETYFGSKRMPIMVQSKNKTVLLEPEDYGMFSDVMKEKAPYQYTLKGW